MPARPLIARGLASLAVAVGIVLGIPGPAAAGADELAPVTESVEAPAEEIQRYWTPARMRNAEPAQPTLRVGRGRGREAGGTGSPARGRPLDVAPSPADDHFMPGLEAERLDSGPQAQNHAPVNRSEINDPRVRPFRTHGKVFFTLGGNDYMCSGTSVTSYNRSVVWTAGHCIYDRAEGGFASRWTFVPAYKDGNAPFGRWAARTLAVTPQWSGSSSFSYDLGAVVVRTNSRGQTLGEVVGARGIAFNQPRTQEYHIFGYPARIPFNGQRLYRCIGPYSGSDNVDGGPPPMRVACDQNAGASGGGWVANGRVLSVISYKYCDPTGLICETDVYGPYQERVAERLYREVRGEPERCQGRVVTHLGTRGNDVIVGTPGRDVIKALGGDDVIRARGGRDRVCAGPGDDLIRGGRGNDRLKGGPGRDLLIGGKGRRDFCDGGAGRDRARGCRITRRIP